MKYAKHHNILRWIETSIYQCNSKGWYLLCYGQQPDVIYNYSFRTITYSTTYVFPVVSQTYVKNFLAIKLLLPPFLKFQYFSQNICGFVQHDDTYLWTWEAGTEPYLNPNPCAHCGWYCNQSCYLWNIK